jgi:hypothetical protein
VYTFAGFICLLAPVRHFTDGEEIHYEDLMQKKHILTLKAAAVGKTIVVDVCWLNPRPQSAPQSIFIV